MPYSYFLKQAEQNGYRDSEAGVPYKSCPYVTPAIVQVWQKGHDQATCDREGVAIILGKVAS